MRLINKFIVSFLYIFPMGGVAGLFASVPALASKGVPKSQNCTIEPLSFPTVKIGNIFKTQPITATLKFSCAPKSNSYIPDESKGEYMAYCWHIHDGGGGKDYNDNGYRGAVLGNNTIWFNFYAEHPMFGIVPVGTIQKPYNIYGRALKNGNTYIASSPVTLKFEHNEGVLDFPAGHYTYENPDTHVTFVVMGAKDTFNKQNACKGGSASETTGSNAIYGSWDGTSTVDINISTYCNVEQTQLDFGTQPQLYKPLTKSVNVHVDCSGGTDYDVSIDNGLHAVNGQRRMQQQNANSPAYIPYSISPVSWSGCGRGTGLANADYQTITGTVPSQSTPPDGAYRDTLKVTAIYRNSTGDPSNPAYCKQQN